MKSFRFSLSTLFLLFACILSSLILTACAEQEPVSETGFYFDTVITITLYDSSNEALLEECFKMAQTYENRFSKTIEGSDVWNINHAAGQKVPVHPDTVSLVRTALKYADLSDGAVDPTIGTVSCLWDFSGESSAVLPDTEKLQEALKHVNYQALFVTDSTVQLSDPDARLDLGFIAKGYIADQMKEYLVSHGVTSAIINLGGNVLTIGSRPDGNAFRVGIQQPFAPSGTAALTLCATNQSIVSSGNYERYFMKDDKLYHHILDTATGYPAQTDVCSVTICSATSTQGDALSTICFLLGSVRGMELVEALENTEAVFIKSDGSLLYSSGLQP